MLSAWSYTIFLFVSEVLGIGMDPWASSPMLDKHTTTVLCPQPWRVALIKASPSPQDYGAKALFTLTTMSPAR